MILSTGKATILFISTFTPKKCGIASFTQDLVDAITPEIKNDMTIEVCALDKPRRAHLYDSAVSMIMDGYNLDSCVETAAKINSDPFIKLVCIEHEFGLYGGELGEYILGFLSLLEKPFIIRLHTILPNPAVKMLAIIRSISLLAERVLVMTKHSAKVLTEDYEISKDKILIIPHGTHAHSTIPATKLKSKYSLKGKHVLTTFGLLSPNKGIEKGIMAMKEISQAFPNAIYMVLGQTHPNLLEQEGEKYRDYLQELIVTHDLQENVKLVNEYMPIDTLMEYLALTDIYLFTSKDPNQAVSGTFLYAMSAGCPIISNSFVLAKEMLDEDTGVVLSTAHEHELAENAIRILNDPALMKKMGNNAHMKTRNTTWKRVGQKHANLFCLIQGSPAIIPDLSSEYITK
jgi:glycosyltransferase involved in cell wall biosynthesis